VEDDDVVVTEWNPLEIDLKIEDDLGENSVEAPPFALLLPVAADCCAVD
jgi:hypothetical protein